MINWAIIKTISNHSNLDSPWVCRVLVFTKHWLDKRTDDIGWVLFHNYLFMKSWIQSSHMRSKSELSIMWEVFASAIRDRNLKPGPYILDNIIHNIFLANGAIPGFIPADTEELLLPSRTVERAYEEVYMLKEYASIIMHPWRLGVMQKHFSVYYSLAYPTLLQGTSALRHAPSIISEIRDIKILMQTLEKILEQHAVPTYNLIRNVVFEYFHTEEDRFGEIEHSQNLVDKDFYLVECMKRFKGKVFPYQGPFFRGCMRITKNQMP